MRSLGASIVNVTTLAPSYNLIDIMTCKTLLGITNTAQDAVLTLWIANASTAVRNFCNNPFVIETMTEQYWPPRDGWPGSVRADTQPLQVSRWPVTGVTSVIETITGTPTTLVQGTDYLLDAPVGQLIRLDTFGYPKGWRSNPIAVVYAAGYATIPSDISDAVSRLVKSAMFAQSRDPALKSETVPGVYSASYAAGMGAMPGNGMPPDVVDLIDNYRVPVFS